MVAFSVQLVGHLWVQINNYNKYRAHFGRDGATPIKSANKKVFDINKYRWTKHCRGLFKLPIAA